MGRWLLGMTATLATIALVVGLAGSSGQVAAQDGEEDDLVATIEALQTQVAELEERVATLEAAADDDEDTGSSRSVPVEPTPASDDDAADGAASEGSGTRDDPVPVGETREIGDYTIRVVEVIPNATDMIMTENSFNDPPVEGNQFFMVTVETTYDGNETGSPSFDLNFQAVGASNVAYTTFDNSCGVVPNDQYSASELFPGGTIQFNVCWSVATEDLDSLVMFVEPLFEFDAVPVFFALR